MSTMTHEEYTRAVDEGRWPDDPFVPLPSAFENASGAIQNLLLTPCQSVAAIVSNLGAVRANHFHRTDWHYTYVAQGEVLYFERAIGATYIPTPWRFKPGEMFFTPPMREHAMLFTMNSLILTFARNVRSHEEHESDLVRVPTFITPDIAREYVP